jgi:hypothetical protein
MKKDLHNIDDLFKKALEEHEDLPSDQVWENIDKNLDKRKVIAISKKYNKLKWIAAGLLLFSVGMAMYMLHVRSASKELVKQNSETKIFRNKKIESSNTLRRNSITSGATETNVRKGSSIKKPDLQKGYVAENNIVSKPKASEQKDVPTSLEQGNATTYNNKSSVPALKQANNQRTQQKTTKQVFYPGKKDGNKFETNPGKQEDTFAEVAPGNLMKSHNAKNNKVASQAYENKNAKSNIFASKDEYINAIPEVTAYDKLADPVQLDFFSPYLKAGTPNGWVAKNSGKASLKQIKLKKARSSLFSATPFFSPDLVSSDLTNDHPMFREDDRNKFEQEERFKFSYTLGLLVDYNITNKWRLETGITYFTRITEIGPKTIFARPDNNGNINYRFNCSAGYTFVTLKSAAPPVSGDSIRTLPSTNTLTYVGVPLSIKYVFPIGKWNIMPGVGIGANFLTQGKIKTGVATTMGDEMATSNSIDGLKSTYFNGSASVGVQYQLSKALGIAFMPTMRFALTSINRDAPVKTDEGSFGLAAGFNFSF